MTSDIESYTVEEKKRMPSAFFFQNYQITYNPEKVTRRAIHFSKHLVKHLVFSNTDTKPIYIEKKTFILIRGPD